MLSLTGSRGSETLKDDEKKRNQSFVVLIPSR
jgi:hypothetical protein